MEVWQGEFVCYQQYIILLRPQQSISTITMGVSVTFVFVHFVTEEEIS